MSPPAAAAGGGAPQYRRPAVSGSASLIRRRATGGGPFDFELPPLTSPIRYRDESGAALVEFALVVPLLLVLILGIADFGRALNYWIDSTHIANVAARYAAVNKNPAASGTLQRHMELQATAPELRDGSAQATPVDVCVTFPGGTNVGDPVRVEVKSTWSWLGYLVEEAGLDLDTELVGRATMRLEAKPTNYSAGCV